MISLSAYNRSNEDDHNNWNGDPSGTCSSSCDDWGGSPGGDQQTNAMQQWIPKSTNFCHTKNRGIRGMKPSFRWGQTGRIWDMCTTRHSWSSSLTNGNGRPIKALVLGCIDGPWEGDTAFSLGLQSTLFQAEIYAIKACVMENIEKGYAGRNMYFLSDR